MPVNLSSNSEQSHGWTKKIKNKNKKTYNKSPAWLAIRLTGAKS